MKNSEQKLIDIVFHIGLMIKNQPNFLHKITDYELADWIRKQLKECGYPTKAVGTSWGVLENESESL